MRFGPIPHFRSPISRVVLGSMGLDPDRRELAFAILDDYIRLGGNAIDTAHVYGEPKHRLIGEFLKERGRDTLIIMDKGCHPYSRNRVTREDMRSDIEDSLNRMGTDHLDFFVLHRDDPEVPAGEVVDWLNELKKEGKVSAFGGSNWSPQRIEEANLYALNHNLQGFSLSSPNFALALPQAEMWAGVQWLNATSRAWFEKNRFPVFSWSSAAGGFFAGVETEDLKRVYFNEDNFGRRSRAIELGKKYGQSPTQIAVAWTLNQPINVFAIVGPRTVEELRENMQAATLELSPSELRYLEHGEE